MTAGRGGHIEFLILNFKFEISNLRFQISNIFDLLSLLPPCPAVVTYRVSYS